MRIFTILALCVLVLGCTKHIPTSEEERLTLREKSTVRLGEFEVVSGRMVATDPGYSRQDAMTPRLGVVIEKCRKGTWNAECVLKSFREQKWTDTAELRVFHDSILDRSAIAGTELEESVGGDTGQAGIWDFLHFKDASVVPPE